MSIPGNRHDIEIEIMTNAYEYWSSGQGSDDEARESGARNHQEMAYWCRESLINLDAEPDDVSDEDGD